MSHFVQRAAGVVYRHRCPIRDGAVQEMQQRGVPAAAADPLHDQHQRFPVEAGAHEARPSLTGPGRADPCGGFLPALQLDRADRAGG